MEPFKINLKYFTIAVVAVVLIEIFFCCYTTVSSSVRERLFLLGVKRSLEVFLLVFICFSFGNRECVRGLLTWSGIKRGLLWSAGFGIIAGIVLLMSCVLGLNILDMFKVALPSGGSDRVLFFFVGGLVGPVAEEFFFRGIIYSFFRNWGIAAAVFFSTLFFVVAHHWRQGIPIVQIAGGVLFALAYEKEKKISVPVTIHSLGNFALFSLTCMAENGNQ